MNRENSNILDAEVCEQYLPKQHRTKTAGRSNDEKHETLTFLLTKMRVLDGGELAIKSTLRSVLNDIRIKWDTHASKIKGYGDCLWSECLD
jgi:hypothetical protein